MSIVLEYVKKKLFFYRDHWSLFGIILGAPIIFSLTVIKLIVMASAHTYLVLVLLSVFDEKCPTKKEAKIRKKF